MHVHDRQKILAEASVPLVFIGQGCYGQALGHDDMHPSVAFGYADSSPSRSTPPNLTGRLTGVFEILGENADGDRWEHAQASDQFPVVCAAAQNDGDDGGAADPGGGGGEMRDMRIRNEKMVIGLACCAFACVFAFVVVLLRHG